jgi:hypothetical protein
LPIASGFGIATVMLVWIRAGPAGHLATRWPEAGGRLSHSLKGKPIYGARMHAGAAVTGPERADASAEVPQSVTHGDQRFAPEFQS